MTTQDKVTDAVAKALYAKWPAKFAGMHHDVARAAIAAYKAKMREAIPAEIESGFAPFSDGEEQAYRLGAKDMHRLILGEGE